MMKSLFQLLLFTSIAVAGNDWSTACHQGQCAWDSSTHGGSASLQLWSSSPTAIADITPAAGWTILTCSGSAAAQTVRIACVDASSGCSHLLDPNTNPIGRILRLTDECGTMPFARIAHMRPADDQTLPSALSRRAAPPAVYDVALDTNFSAGSEHGTVNFALTASSLPDVHARTIERVPRGRYLPRSFAEELDSASKRAYMKHGLRELATVPQEDFQNSFDKQDNMSFPVNINQSNLNVFNTTINCQSSPVPFDASISVDVDAVVDAQFTLGVVVTGHLLPLPKLDSAAITAGMTGSIDSALHVKASADGIFSSPSITLLDLPLPGGIDIPGILQLGPAFKVLASANANLGNGIDTTIGLTYQIDNANMVFPPDQGESGGNFSPNETPLQLSMDTNVTGSISLTGHLIPELVIGIEVLEGAVKSEITLSLDASATVTVDGGADVTDTTGSSAVLTAQGACVDVSTALAVNAGASAGLLDIFSSGASVNLFDKSFDLYNSCTGSADATSTSADNRATASSSVESLASSSTVQASSAEYSATSMTTNIASTVLEPEPTVTSTSTGSSSTATYSVSARALPVAVSVPRAAAVDVHSLSKRDITCPRLPFNIHAPTTTNKATPTATSS
ncbi:unnamed protein product [Peniophora sp. CBMAI 1063]|nr:unnamed protein product [Peniophora sp. CBMAI 1063]